MKDRLATLFRRYYVRGDLDALSRVFDAVSPKLLGLALHLVADQDDAEDLVQATFLAAIESAADFDADRPFVPWISGILGNRVRELRKLRGRPPRTSRHRADHSDHGALVDPEPAEPGSDEIRGTIRRSVESLPDPYGEVVRLSVCSGLRPAEIAIALQRSPATVRTQLRRGLRLLRDQLPAGLGAAWLTMATPSRGLAAVRRVVLDAGARRAGGAVTVAGARSAATRSLLTWGGLGLGVAIIGLGLWLLGREPTPGSSLDTASTELVAAPEARARRAPRGPLETPEPSAPPPATSAAPEEAVDQSIATLSIETVQAGARRPAPRVGVRLTWKHDGLTRWRTGRTDDSGRATFELPPRGTVIVFFDRGRVADGRMRTLRLFGGARHRIRYTVPEGFTVDGTVVDAAGDPVPDAAIWLGYSTRDGVEVIRTDGRGRFSLHAIVAGHYLAARHPGHAPSRMRRLEPADGATRITLALGGPAAAIEGTVRGPDGAALAGATVKVGVMHPARDAARGDWDPPPATATTTEHGEFRVAGLACGPTRAFIRAGDLAPHGETVRLTASSPTRLDVRLEPGASIRGTVRGPWGDPVPSASLTLGHPRRPGFVGIEADAGGRFVFRGLIPGSYPLKVTSRHYADHVQTVELAGGETTHVDVTVSSGLAIRGRLLDEAGRPLAHRRIEARAPGAVPQAAWWRRTLTDADGRFDLPSCLAAEYVVEARDPSLAHTAAVATGVRPATPAVEVELVARLAPTAWLTGEAAPGTHEVEVVAVTFGSVASDDAVEPTGRFRIGPLVAAKYLLRLDGGPWRGPLEIVDGQTLDIGRVSHLAGADDFVVLTDETRWPHAFPRDAVPRTPPGAEARGSCPGPVRQDRIR